MTCGAAAQHVVGLWLRSPVRALAAVAGRRRARPPEPRLPGRQGLRDDLAELEQPLDRRWCSRQCAGSADQRWPTLVALTAPSGGGSGLTRIEGVPPWAGRWPAAPPRSGVLTLPPAMLTSSQQKVWMQGRELRSPGATCSVEQDNAAARLAALASPELLEPAAHSRPAALASSTLPYHTTRNEPAPSRTPRHRLSRARVQPPGRRPPPATRAWRRTSRASCCRRSQPCGWRRQPTPGAALSTGSHGRALPAQGAGLRHLPGRPALAAGRQRAGRAG